VAVRGGGVDKPSLCFQPQNYILKRIEELAVFQKRAAPRFGDQPTLQRTEQNQTGTKRNEAEMQNIRRISLSRFAIEAQLLDLAVQDVSGGRRGREGCI